MWVFNLYWRFTCIDKNNKNETNLPSPPFHSSYNFLNCWKTNITIKSTTLKFSGFQFVFINLLSAWPARMFFKNKYNSRTIHEISRKVQAFKLLEVGKKNAKQGLDKNT